MNAVQAVKAVQAVAVFANSPVGIEGNVTFEDVNNDCKVTADFSALPPGKHGFHIHKNGDLRGSGCKGACDHYHKGAPTVHGGPPDQPGRRHTGDLGNVEPLEGRPGSVFYKTYFLKNVKSSELFGRALIVHEDEDDLGLGPYEDSLTTGHSGSRIACAIIGRGNACEQPNRKTLRGGKRRFFGKI